MLRARQMVRCTRCMHVQRCEGVRARKGREVLRCGGVHTCGVHAALCTQSDVPKGRLGVAAALLETAGEPTVAKMNRPSRFQVCGPGHTHGIVRVDRGPQGPCGAHLYLCATDGCKSACGHGLWECPGFLFCWLACCFICEPFVA